MYKMSTNSMLFKRKHGIPVKDSLSLSDISKLSGVPLKALQEVYDKGMGAYATNPTSVRKSVSSPQQWAVYSFVMKRPQTFGKADSHIAEKYKTKKIK